MRDGPLSVAETTREVEHVRVGRVGVRQVRSVRAFGLRIGEVARRSCLGDIEDKVKEEVRKLHWSFSVSSGRGGSRPGSQKILNRAQTVRKAS